MGDNMYNWWDGREVLAIMMASVNFCCDFGPSTRRGVIYTQVCR